MILREFTMILNVAVIFWGKALKPLTGTRLQSHTLYDYNWCQLSCVSRFFYPFNQLLRLRYLSLCRAFSRCLLSKRALRLSMVVIRTPSCTNQLRFHEWHRNLAWQKLVAQFGVETFNVPVLLRRAWLYVRRIRSAFLARWLLSKIARFCGLNFSFYPRVFYHFQAFVEPEMVQWFVIHAPTFTTQQVLHVSSTTSLMLA